MKGDREILSEVIPEQIQTREEVLQYLLDNNVVSNTFLRDLRIIYNYRSHRRSEGAYGAVLTTCVKTNCSQMTVYRARQRFEKK